MSYKTFQWSGIDSNGKKIKGKIDAANKTQARTLLASKNIAVLSISTVMTFFSHAQKFSPKDRLDFTQQCQLLLQAGIPLADALSLIATSSPHHAIQTFITSIKEKIISGMSFSAALRLYPKHFDPLFCQLIAAGEKSGELEKVLSQLIDNQEQQSQLKNKIAKALFYPIGILCVSILITIGLLIFVIPQFSNIYANFNAQLPHMTRILISFSNIILHHGMIFLIFIAALIITVRLFSKKIFKLGNIFQRCLFLFPPYRSLIVTKQVAQWSQLLSITLQASIPLTDALSIAHQSISNAQFQAQLSNVNRDVINGKSLHAALDACIHFPARAKYLISVGENADALDIMMKKIALIYKQKLDTTLDHLSKLVEPVIMIGVASLISGLIIAMYLPIFRMGSVI